MASDDWASGVGRGPYGMVSGKGIPVHDVIIKTRLQLLVLLASAPGQCVVPMGEKAHCDPH
ncbi:predicted protein [Plenodomus lingam JN3]|uniref:Predicted protein n=1 Tax=Leptosphaeria maculans (strain JN3 / isolate v23.1.3 / race Av1-4-5-6-7-8) TaxID=985895 RepID=E4ZQ63_LEPMJ|nr:predicted protein [Plenodomus lingam JN3]CBX89973.1 predicted protein [Plenodomus lingam JN3]